MICPHCGNNVSRDQETCSSCGKPTQFSQKFNFRPSSAPIGGVGSSDRSVNDLKDTSVNPQEIARVINSALPSRRTIQRWLYTYIGISLAVVVLSFLVSLIVFSSSNHRMEQTIESLLTTPTIKPMLSPSPTTSQILASAEIQFDKNIPRNAKDDQVKDFPKSEIKTEGSPLNLDFGPSLEGYLFAGWNTAEDGKGISFPKNSMLNVNPDSDVLTLYAQWVEPEGGTLIVFDPNPPTSASVENVIDMPDKLKILPNGSMPLQEPTLVGYRFVEWNTEANGAGISIRSGSTFGINLDMEILTLFAQWS